MVNARVPVSEMAAEFRELTILMAWGSQHAVVRTAPAMPMVSTSNPFMRLQ